MEIWAESPASECRGQPGSGVARCPSANASSKVYARGVFGPWQLRLASSVDTRQPFSSAREQVYAC
jgi:hypothetical protein